MSQFDHSYNSSLLTSVPTPELGRSRKRHKKSRTGCKNCKRRHIRCDEHNPQCRNCVKYGVRCDYLNNVATDEPILSVAPVRDLFWSREVESIINYWEREGEATFGEFSIDLCVDDYEYRRNDLHLLYQVLSEQAIGVEDKTAWRPTVLKALATATSYPFLVQAILGFMAQGVAWKKNTTSSKTLAYHHGGVALHGFQRAMERLSQENPDAALLASTLLIWQCNNWQSYTSLWSDTNQILNYIRLQRLPSSIPSLVKEVEICGALYLKGVHSQPTAQTDASNRIYSNMAHQLYEAFDVLQGYLTNHPAALKWTEQYKDYFQRLLSIGPAKTCEEQFNYLYIFRKWMFWIPKSLLEVLVDDTMSLVFIAYIYAAAQDLGRIFPEVAPSLCSLMTVRPMYKVLETLERTMKPAMSTSTQYNRMSGLLEFPRHSVAAFQEKFPQSQLLRDPEATGSRMQWFGVLPDLFTSRLPENHDVTSAEPLGISPVYEPLDQQGLRYVSPYSSSSTTQPRQPFLSPSVDQTAFSRDPSTEDLILNSH